MTTLRMYPEGGAIDSANSATKLIEIGMNGGSFPAANGDFPSGSWAGMQDNDEILMGWQSEATPGGNDPTGAQVPWTLGDTLSNNQVAVYRDGVRHNSDFDARTAGTIGPGGHVIKQILHCNKKITIEQLKSKLNNKEIEHP